VRKRQRELLGEEYQQSAEEVATEQPPWRGKPFQRLMHLDRDRQHGATPVPLAARHAAQSNRPGAPAAGRRPLPRPPATPPPQRLLRAREAAPPQPRDIVTSPIKPIRPLRPLVRQAAPPAAAHRPTARAPTVQAEPTAPVVAIPAKQLTLDGEGVFMQEHPELPVSGVAVAVPYGTGAPPARLLSGSREILDWLLGGSAAGEFELLDDPHWHRYPEVSAAWRTPGDEELSLCIAVCAGRAVWGAGFAGRWKTREQAAQLALAAALAHEAGGVLPGILDHYPEFADLLRAPAPAAVGAPSRKRRRRCGPRRGSAALAEAPKEEIPEEILGEPAELEEAKPEAESPGEDGDGELPLFMPRELPIWISLPEDEPMPEELQGLPGEALVLNSDCPKDAVTLFAEEALERVLGDDGPPIEYHDSPRWSRFLPVGRALLELGQNKECFVVAICRPLNVWAVGVGMRVEHRHLSAKAALAAMLALQAADQDDDLVLDDLPLFSSFLEEARVQALGGQEAPEE